MRLSLASAYRPLRALFIGLALLLALAPAAPISAAAPAAPISAAARAATPIPAGHIRVHYFRPDAAYTGWTLYAFGDTTEDTNNFSGGPVQIAGSDSFGVYFDVGVTATAKNVGILLHNGGTKDPGPDEFADPATQGAEYWQLSGVPGLFTTQPPTTSQKNPAIPAATARVHFFRPDAIYTGWTVYAFNDTTADDRQLQRRSYSGHRDRRIWCLLRRSAQAQRPGPRLHRPQYPDRPPRTHRRTCI